VYRSLIDDTEFQAESVPAVVSLSQQIEHEHVLL